MIGLGTIIAYWVGKDGGFRWLPQGHEERGPNGSKIRSRSVEHRPASTDSFRRYRAYNSRRGYEIVPRGSHEF